MKNELIQWIIRFIKGIFIGSGAILPGVSGGALAAVFGIYEEIIQFISNIKKEFKSKLFFFLPVGLGALFGIIVLAYPIEALLRNHPVFILLFFMGCIFGTVPLLYRKAKLHGQKKWHIYLTVLTTIVSFILLISANTFLDVQVAQTPVTWIMVGFIFALGFIVPGLSPSNFLIYMNLYEPLTRGISRLDWMILLPVGIGALICIIALSKLVNHLMNFYYTTIFHFILGIVIASTVIIFPSQNQWSQLSLLGVILSIVLFIIGLLLGLWMGRLELKHKPED
ncbi:DUF368 domain-containing protein [Marinilactibacillus sp. GCM10026970]|uniref:DUF368 domain-containing protein n=1 Tax=Marinilactibacillus sp. GCM10026970 TaxID=3252642 RepID=UPI0036062899